MRDEDSIIDFNEFIRKGFSKKEFSEENSETVTYRFRYIKDINTSFLIPEELILKRRQAGWRRGSSYSGLVRSLLEGSAFPIYQGLIPKIRKKVTRTYQNTGLALKKVSCRIHDRDLVEMDIMAQALGISRSRLLVLMLEWEELGWLEVMRALGVVRSTTSFQSLESHQYLRKNYQTPIPTYTIQIKHCTNSS
ncbi:hypothetical protein LPTSP3_g14290 [Leptospira kobayashii]|uniref:PF07600 family protein n=1 Tax=Leptospira kobayashii TaxID=1917830 RepID=A0ABN6KBZ7_9LEPT|nr:DUF1564 family protein [Leptospira kobayashii]BDA78499.1 hypothetical protein LPTSP3_g14290 [Leptospira kobayashii]